MGELSLDGSVRGVNGILPMTIAAAAAGIKAVFLPAENALEASAVENIEIYAVENVKQVVAHLAGETLLQRVPVLEEQIKVANHRIEDLEKERGE